MFTSLYRGIHNYHFVIPQLNFFTTCFYNSILWYSVMLLESVEVVVDLVQGKY